MGLAPAVAAVERHLLRLTALLSRISIPLLRALRRTCGCSFCGAGVCRRSRDGLRSPPALPTAVVLGGCGDSGAAAAVSSVSGTLTAAASPRADEDGSSRSRVAGRSPAVVSVAVTGASPAASGAAVASAATSQAARTSAAYSPEKPPPLDADEERRSDYSGRGRRIVHHAAVATVVITVVFTIAGVVFVVVRSILSLRDHWAVYQRGAHDFAELLQRATTRVSLALPKRLYDDLATSGLARVEGYISELAGELLKNIWRFILEVVMMAVYICFWLADPMPMGSDVEELFKRYIILKGAACLGYGICVGILLFTLGVDLAAVFGLSAFLLSFVPEVGSMLAILLPAPVIIFDSRLESPATTLLTASFAQLGLKFIFANVVEVKLVEADQLMRMHPVIILLAVAFFGFIWGPTGMLLSVPLVAYLKVALLSDRVPSRYRDPVLVILEGDRDAPAKHSARRRRRTSAPLSPQVEAPTTEMQEWKGVASLAASMSHLERGESHGEGMAALPAATELDTRDGVDDVEDDELRGLLEAANGR
eukprot:TRINITY_DN7828_c0_g1_i3.p1 TRINITY_DN7828_c0_g1~~TRINITY_DN7828_c0_g1_i3.p1  ORF type:complete len:619 (-),score=151.99 TRINITY_DN7828_c0_g1_i3:205-1815(-)